MADRRIIRSADILDGRWHFAGTTVPVAEVRLSHRFQSPDDGLAMTYPDLTRSEIAAALAFDFPVIREAAIDVEYAAVTMHCECGENTPHATAWPEELKVECPCGRTWMVVITFRLLTQGALIQA